MERRAFFVRLSQHAGLIALGTGCSRRDAVAVSTAWS